MLGEIDDNLEFHIHIMWCAQALYHAVSLKKKKKKKKALYHAISNVEMSLLLYASCDR